MRTKYTVPYYLIHLDEFLKNLRKNLLKNSNLTSVLEIK